MERVKTLLQKLQQQMTDKAGMDQLLLTTNMLQHELMHLLAGKQVNGEKSVVVSMPLRHQNIQSPLSDTTVQQNTEPEGKTVQVLEINEEEIEAELEEIKKNASVMKQIIGKSKPHLLFDTDADEIPTLAHQNFNRSQELNQRVMSEGTSLNDRLKEIKIEISEKLNEMPVKDLKKAIGINDRFLYINDLFRGDEAMYERSIKTINSFSIWPEAEYWIRRELKTKLGWTDEDPTVKQFDQLVKRRFS